MIQRISLKKAITLSLGDMNQSVITKYHLGLLLFQLYSHKKYKNYSLYIKNQYPDSENLSQSIKDLTDIGVIRPHPSVPQCYMLVGGKNIQAEEIVCSADPFAFVSHLSAMAYHGLTNRMPATLFISSPSPKKWKEFALERMKKDLGTYLEVYLRNGLPRLQKISFKNIGKQKINCYSGIHMGTFKKTEDEKIRVSTIGRTFLEMLQQPDLCGGIYHVIEVFEEYAEQYLDLVVNEIENNGKQIDKVRAGYILDEICGLEHDYSDNWLQFVQRGGSRKLDPGRNYSSEYSKKWCISLNT